VIKVAWLNGKINDFYMYLAEHDHHNIYDNELIKVLLY
jgi:hypothetical protein